MLVNLHDNVLLFILYNIIEYIFDNGCGESTLFRAVRRV